MSNSKNKIEDLRNHLFVQLERLNKEDCDLDKETQRATSLVQVASSIIETGRVEVEFLRATTGDGNASTGFFPVAKDQRKYFIEKEKP